MINRSRTDIVGDILGIAENGAGKTRIMYGAFLSFPQSKAYLEFLTASGLLEYSEEEKLYRTTEKGKHFLRIYEEMKQVISPSESRVIAR